MKYSRPDIKEAKSNIRHNTECTLLDKKYHLNLYSTDSAGRVHAIPDIVVLPSTPEDVASVLRIANEIKISVKPRGAANTARGESIANGGILIDMKSLDNIIDIDKKRKTIEAEAGITYFKLYEELMKNGLTLKTASCNMIPCLGATINQGGFGDASFRGGSCAEQVLEIEVALPDGSLKRCSKEKNTEYLITASMDMGNSASLPKQESKRRTIKNSLNFIS